MVFLCPWQVLKAHSLHCSLLRKVRKKERIKINSMFLLPRVSLHLLDSHVLSLSPHIPFLPFPYKPSPLSLATFQSLAVSLSLPLIFSPSVSLSFSFSLAQLRNTVTEPKDTNTPAKKWEEDKQCHKLLHCEISLPLQRSMPSSVKPFMKPISL